ncbi:hypothetical protein KCP76_08155 [Salmonella enterica subsp. enterica serovar Weltevreden]|nr:hypothetical protein KCP76_08155 [Salmonella enterica subsp. enterica serovar Weltevreden]
MRSEDSRDARAHESRLKENLPLITLIIMMAAISWGLGVNHRSAMRRFIATILVGLYPYCPPGAAADESGSWFAIPS